MSKNSFDKQVQLKMDALRLRPSPEVWSEVEKRIRKEKKDRRFVLWISLSAALLLAGTGWWIINGNKKQTSANNFQAQAITNKKKNDISVVPNEKTQFEVMPENNAVGKNKRIDSLKIINPARIKVVALPDNIKNTSPIVSKTGYYRKTSEETISSADLFKKKYLNNSKLVLSSVEKNDQLGDAVTSGHVAMNDKSSQQPLLEPLNMNTDSLKMNKQKTQNLFVINKDSSESDKQESSKLSVEDLKHSPVIAVSESKPSAKNGNTKKWTFSIMLEKGVSNIGEGIAIFDKKANADIPLASASSSLSVGALLRYYHTSLISSATSFSGGIVATYPLSKRLDVNLGLSYLNLANKVAVGNRVDSSFAFNNYAGYGYAANYFRTSPVGSDSYKSQYHFISLSEGFSWKFINNRKFHVSWDNDIIYSLLISSNVLYFDRGLQGYYKDSKLLSHNNIFLSTGFSFPISKKLELNPFASWGITDVWRYAVDASQKNYFTNYGLKVKFSINKK